MTSDARDLSALTAPPPRRAETLPPPPPRAAPAPREEQAPAPAVEPSPEEERPAKAPKEQAKKAAATPPVEDDRKHAVPIYLPGPLFAGLRAAAAKREQTYSDWVLDAYDRIHPRLGERFTPAAARESGLPPRKSQRRRVDTPTPVQLRLTDPEETVLDRKREEVGGPSKSAFYSAIVELGLETE